MTASTPDRDHAELTSYVGRTVEMESALRLLDTDRLVTLVGPGGVGKTRLCRRVLANARGRFADGAAFVGLAELRDGHLLGNAVAYQLGLSDQSTRAPAQAVVDHLRDKEFLLVLDNCEHLPAAVVSFVDDILQYCPRVVVLATSRQSLGVSGERLLPVSPLEVPGEGVESLDALTQCDAVRLFVDRAGAVVPTFTVTEHNSGDLARVSRKLDGLPLAIELAAVRVRALSLGQLADRLDSRLSLLTVGARGSPSRQRTLRAMIDWSHELCSEPERLVWARASVFSGGFDLAAAEQVCGGEGVDPAEVVDIIDSLIDKSILSREEHGGLARYGMLESLREYGQDRLGAAEERLRVARLHRDWCYALTRHFFSHWIGPDQVALLARLRREHANLRVALEFSFTVDEARIAAYMLSMLGAYWSIRAGYSECRFWANRALAALPPGAPERLPAVLVEGLSAVHQGEIDFVRAQLAAHEDLRAAAANPVLDANFALVRGMAELYTDHEANARDQFEQALTAFRDLDFQPGVYYAANVYGLTTALAGDCETGRRLLREAIAASERIGEIFWRANGLCFLGVVEMLDGEPAAIREAATVALRLQQLVDDRFGEAMSVSQLAYAAHQDKDPDTAATLLAVSDALWEAMAMAPMRTGRFGILTWSYVEGIEATLPPSRFRSLVATGRAMPKVRWLPYALGEAESSPAASPLTRREAQVAGLVAQGLPNREIATKLFISPRTAETHVDHILSKLGLRNRTQVAAWVSEHSPAD